MRRQKDIISQFAIKPCLQFLPNDCRLKIWPLIKIDHSFTRNGFQVNRTIPGWLARSLMNSGALNSERLPRHCTE
jgi:hypothetical protein